MPGDAKCVVGIDPGYGSIGVSVIELTREPTVLNSASWEIKNKERKLPETRRVGMIVDFAASIIAPYQNRVKLVALEGGVIMGKHGRTTEKLAMSRGGLLYWLDVHGLPAATFPPAEVKKTITGSGKADKLMIQRAVEMWLRQPTRTEHEADACAVAYCAFLQARNGGTL